MLNVFSMLKLVHGNNSSLIIIDSNSSLLLAWSSLMGLLICFLQVSSSGLLLVTSLLLSPIKHRVATCITSISPGALEIHNGLPSRSDDGWQNINKVHREDGRNLGKIQVQQSCARV